MKTIKHNFNQEELRFTHIQAKVMFQQDGSNTIRVRNFDTNTNEIKSSVFLYMGETQEELATLIKMNEKVIGTLNNTEEIEMKYQNEINKNRDYIMLTK